MKFSAVMALLATATVAQSAEVSPISKVLQMIGDLQSKIIKEGEAAQKTYAEFSEWCEDRSKDLDYEIKTGKSQVEELKAAIAEEVSLSTSLTTKVEELVASISSNEADLSAATKVRESEQADFAAEEKELMEVIETLERAIAIIEREMAKHSGAFVQLQNVKNVEQALKIMVQAAMIGTGDASRLTALVQGGSASMDSDSDMEEGAPAAAAYEGQSSGIIDVMQDLLEKAQEELDAARKKEETAVHNFQMLKQSLTDEIKFATKDMDESKKAISTSAEKKATAEGDLTTTSKDLAADIEAKGSMKHDCMTKAEDFESEVKSRGEELAALAKAKEIITEMTGAATDKVYSFVQLASSTDLANFEVVRFVRDLSHKQHSPVLAQLAQRMAAAIRLGNRSGARDPFAKVKTLITDMIAKLEAEAAKEATKKAYCDKEMAETAEKKADKSDEVEKLTTKIDQMTAKSAKLREEVTALQKSLAELQSSQAEMDKIRAAENAEYKVNKADLEQGVEGVKKALAVLKDYYAKEDKAHSSADGAGSGIIGMLEVCESDFSKELAEIVSVEEQSASEYETVTKENGMEKLTKEQDVKYKTKESTSLDKSVAETSSDLSSVQAELDAVLDYEKQINAECIAKPESYETKVARRKAEMAGLKEALEILENEAALTQVGSVRKALRGVSPHRQA
jgi:DNA repair exonuclease SbcCD ATPase subunit